MNYKKSDIDSGIRNLVDLINKIPFVETDLSCEGHIENPYSRSSPITPDMNEVFIRSGGLSFYIDGQLDVSKVPIKIDHFNHPLAKEFLRRLKKLTKKYPFTELRLLNMYDAEELKPSYYFRIWNDEIVSYEVGIERKRQINEVWKEFEKLCNDFINEFKLKTQ
jgi:hypothetical protein